MESTVHGEPSFRLVSDEVDLCVTARGGHMAPVVFHLPGRDVSPYALAPWQPSEFPDLPPLLSVLRGDFLCLPFGGQTAGPPHGDPANAAWSPVTASPRSLVLAQQAADSGARLEKHLILRDGHHAVYIDHRISGLDGAWNFGNHPVLDLSELPDGRGRISTSAFHWASVYPGNFSDPAAGESQALAPGATFTDLASVPLAAGGSTDLTRYPARPGNDDLVMLANAPATPRQPFAWSAAVFDGWVWFSLKNPAQFPCTAFWISNGGRSAPPWNGRHRGRLGIEELCSHFSDGVDVAREDRLAARGIPTTRTFAPGEIVSLRVIQGVAPLPAGFGKVVSIAPAGRAVVLTGDSGLPVTVPLDWEFVR